VRTLPRRRSPFLLYWTSATCSYLGDGVRVTALPLLAASLSSSPGQVAAISAAAGLPWLVFGLPAGVLVDRVARAPLMTLLQTVRGVVGALALAGVLAGRIGILALAMLAVLLGTCEVGFDIAAHALLPELVPAGRLQWANGRLVSAEVAAFEFFGPLLGGVLFAATAALPFAVDAATFLASAVLLGIVARAVAPRTAPRPPDTAEEPVARQMTEGLRWFARSPPIRTLTLLTTSINLGAGGFYAVLVLFAREELALGPAGYGALIAVSALGSLVAGIAAEKADSRRARHLVCLWTAPAVAICFGLVAAVPVRLVAAGAMVTFGLVVSLFNVVTVSLRQAIVPRHLLGRVLSVHRVLCWGALPVGALMAGAVASGPGLRWAVAACGAAVVVTWLATLRRGRGWRGSPARAPGGG
jgi:Transmembrane secretion effector